MSNLGAQIKVFLKPDAKKIAVLFILFSVLLTANLFKLEVMGSEHALMNGFCQNFLEIASERCEIDCNSTCFRIVESNEHINSTWNNLQSANKVLFASSGTDSIIAALSPITLSDGRQIPSFYTGIFMGGIERVAITILYLYLLSCLLVFFYQRMMFSKPVRK